MMSLFVCCFDASVIQTATLNLIEALFATQEFVINDEATILQPNSHYYRLDGSTRRRQEVIDRFNNPRSPVRLFLISTLAGGVGISLVGATRAILCVAVLRFVLFRFVCVACHVMSCRVKSF